MFVRGIIMARGEQEKYCIDQVNKLFLQHKVTCLGKYENFVFVKRAFSKVKPNSSSSEFPDFLFDDGFIEHFQVTSTRENRKGSEFRKEQNIFHKKCEENIEAKTATSNPTIGTFALESCPMTMESPESSYDNYKKSFERNWSHHIESRKAYALSGKCIFLIEMVGKPITVEDGGFKFFYKLAYDKDILEYIYEFREEVDYVVFTHSDQCEIVTVAEIPDNKKTLPSNMKFGVGNHTEVNLQVFFDIN